MVITNKNTNGVRTVPLGEREVMQELTILDPNYGKIVVGTNGTYGGEVRLAKDSDVATNTASIAVLGGRVVIAENDITSLENAVVSLDTRLDTAESDINTLETTSSGLVTNVNSLGIRITATELAINNSHLVRADKYLAAQNIANITYVSGNLVKIQYNAASDNDYEVLAYSGSSLTSITHYVGTVLKGTTTLTYSSGALISAIFVGA